MHLLAPVLALALLAGSHASIGLTGPLEDAKCTVEDVRIVSWRPCTRTSTWQLTSCGRPAWFYLQANAAQIQSIVEELVNTTYFRLFRVNLDSDLCPFWKTAKPPPPPSCSGPGSRSSLLMHML